MFGNLEAFNSPVKDPGQTADKAEMAGSQQESLEKLWKDEYFLKNSWPLNDAPNYFRKQRMEQPLQMCIILAKTKALKEDLFGGMFKEVRDFFTRYYQQNSVHVYSDWKDTCRKDDVSAHCDALYNVLRDMPTLVLVPDISDGEFNLSLDYWG